MTNSGLRWKEKISYGLGDVASNMSWNMISGFLLYFYTDVAGIAIGATGTLMLFSRVLDALIDPAIGTLVDRTSTRYGKARPYLLYLAIPFGAVLAALFMAPFQSEPGRLIYAYVTLNLIGILYSLVNIPYASLMSLMTRDTNQKMQLGSLRTIGSSIGTFLVTASTLPLVQLLGPDKRSGFALTATLFGAIAALLFFVVFANCRERYQEHINRAERSLARSLRDLSRNLPWKVTFLFGALILVRLGALIAATIYFAVHVLHKPWLISVLLPIISITFGISAIFAPAYYKRAGIRRGNIVALSVAAGLFAMLPLVEHTMWAFIAIYTASSLAVGFCTTSLFAMAADSVDYQQWKFGTRDDGLLFSSISFSTKVGMAVGSSFVAYVLAWAHFDPAHVTEAAVLSIRSLYYAVPPILMVVQAIVVCFYRLDKLHPEIIRDLANRSVMQLDATLDSAKSTIH